MGIRTSAGPTPALTGIKDANGNEEIKFVSVASAVNEITVTNAATGNNPSVSSTGDDATLDVNLIGKADGRGIVIKTTTNVSPTIRFNDPANGPLIVGSSDNTALYLGGAATAIMFLTSANAGVKSTAVFGWTLGQFYEALDTGLSRNAAGLVEINNGTAGTWRDLKVRQHYVDQTITAGGTTGAQTINKAAGTVNFAAAQSSLVVTNSLVTANSTIFCSIRTNDTTALIKNVVPAAGSFTIRLNANTTAETSVGFLVVN